jgi:hypothetical protein
MMAAQIANSKEVKLPTREKAFVDQSLNLWVAGVEGVQHPLKINHLIKVRQHDSPK